MTRYMLAIISLPLTLTVGCGPSNLSDGTGEDGSSSGDNTQCEGLHCSDFHATLRSIAPYGWSGTHSGFLPDHNSVDDFVCEDTSECVVNLQDAGNWQIGINGDTFICASQIALLTDDGSTVEVKEEWTGEGICGLAPEGEYSGMTVHTDIGLHGGLDQVWIDVGAWTAPITENYFFYEDDEYLLEGTVSDDLMSIDWYLGGPGTSGDPTTIYLEGY